jgi:hypothetical protein
VAGVVVGVEVQTLVYQQKLRELKSQLQQARRARTLPSKVNDFGCYSAPLLDAHHDVTRFDVAMNELLLVDRSQPGSGLRRDFERQLHLDPA